MSFLKLSKKERERRSKFLSSFKGFKGKHKKAKEPKKTKVPDMFTRNVLQDAANQGMSRDTSAEDRIKEEAKRTRETFAFLSPSLDGERKTSTPEMKLKPQTQRRVERDPIDIPSSIGMPTRTDIDIPSSDKYKRKSIEVPQAELDEIIKQRTYERERQRKEKEHSGTVMNLTAGLNDVLGSAVKTLKWLRASGPAGNTELQKHLSEGKIQEVINSKLESAIESFEKGSTIYSVSNPNLMDKVTRSSVSAASFFLPGYGVMKGAQAMNMTPAAASILAQITMTSLEASMEAGEVYNELLGQGMSAGEANNKATAVFGLNALLIGITNKYGLGDFAKKNLAKKLLAGPSEGIQEAGQQIISNLMTGKPMMEGVGEAALIGTILGIPMGMVSVDSVKQELDFKEPSIAKPREIGGGKDDDLKLVRDGEEVFIRGKDYKEPVIVEPKKKEYKEPVVVEEKKEVDAKITEGLESYVFYNNREKMTTETVDNIDKLNIKPKEKVTLYRDGEIDNKQFQSWSKDEKIGKNVISQEFTPDEILIDLTDPKAVELFTEIGQESLAKYKKLENEVIVKAGEVKQKEQTFKTAEELVTAKKGEKVMELDGEERIIDGFDGDEVLMYSPEQNTTGYYSLEEVSNLISKQDEIKTKNEKQVKEKAEKEVEEKKEKKAYDELYGFEKGKTPKAVGLARKVLSVPIRINNGERRTKKEMIRAYIDKGYSVNEGKDILRKPKEDGSGWHQHGIKLNKTMGEFASFIEEKGETKPQYEKQAPTKKKTITEKKETAPTTKKVDVPSMKVPEYESAIELPELVKLYEMLTGGKLPFLRKYPKAWGAFYPDPNNIKIGIHTDILKARDKNQIVKTMAHEIGHLIDFLPEMNIKRGNILNRLESLVHIRKGLFGDEALIKERKNVMNAISKWNRVEKTRPLTIEESLKRDKKIERFNEINEDLVIDKEYRAELIKLTQLWKPFDTKIDPEYTSYRHSSAELYADFVSVLFNNPEIVQQETPKTYKRFFEFLDSKPEVKEAYFEITARVRGEAKDLLAYRKDDIHKDIITGREIEDAKIAQRIIDRKGPGILKDMQNDYLEINTKMIDEQNKMTAKGKTIKPENNPALLAEEMSFTQNEVADVMDKIRPVEKILKKNEISTIDFSTYLFFRRVRDGRKDTVAPRGHTVKSSNDGMNDMKKEMGDEKYKELEKAANLLNDLSRKELQNSVKAGMLSQEDLETIESAKDFYATFRVIKYMVDNEVTAGLHKVVGTFEAIGDVYAATIAKMVTMRVANVRNNQRLRSVNTFKRDISSKEIKFADGIKVDVPSLVNGKKSFPTMTFNPHTKIGNTKLDLVMYKEDGELKGVYLDPQIALSLNYYPNQEIERVTRGLKWIYDKVLRKTFIDYSVRFIINNPIRDLTDAYTALNMLDLQGTGKFKVGKSELLVEYVKAINATFNYARTGKKNKIMQGLLDNKIIGVDQDFSYSAGQFEEADTFNREMIKRGIMTKDGKLNKNKIMQALDIINKVAQITGQTTELATKAAVYKMMDAHLTGKGVKMNKETAAYIRNMVGTPNFRKGGKVTQFFNTWFPFGNIALQGYKRSYELAKNPNTRSGFLWRTTETAILPTLLKIAALEGLLGGGGDEEKGIPDHGIKKWMKGFSSYELRNYHIIALFEKDGISHGTKIPMGFTGKIFSSVLWEIYRAARRGDVRAKEFIDLSLEALPSIHPAINMGGAWMDFARGVNPYDSHFGHFVINEYSFGASKLSDFFDMSIWSWNQIFGGIWKINTYGLPKDASLITKVFDKAPLFTSSNYGYKEIDAEEAKAGEKSVKQEYVLKNKIIEESISEMKRNKDENKAEIYARNAVYKYIKEGDNIDDTKAKAFQKKWIKLYLRSSDPDLDVLLSGYGKARQIAAIKGMYSRLPHDEYIKNRNLISEQLKIISRNTWIEAELEIAEDQK